MKQDLEKKLRELSGDFQSLGHFGEFCTKLAYMDHKCTDSRSIVLSVGTVDNEPTLIAELFEKDQQVAHLYLYARSQAMQYSQDFFKDYTPYFHLTKAAESDDSQDSESS